MQRQQEIDEAMERAMRQHASGQRVDRATFLAQHQHLMPEIEEQFRRWMLILASRDRPNFRSAKTKPVVSDLTVEFSTRSQIVPINDATSRQNARATPDCSAPIVSATDGRAKRQAGSFGSVSHESAGHGQAERAAAEPGSAEMPKTIDRYAITRLLGTGGFGNVYLATDCQLDRQVAIKVPHHAQTLSLERLETYRREARYAARLDHPSIVPVYDVGATEDGVFYIVSKFIDGQNLLQVIRQRPLMPDKIAGIMQQVAGAVHYAHTRDLVHRDIKPSNILLDAKQRAYLTDFGLALHDRDVLEGFECVGTPAYMSPEQAGGEVHLIDGRSDVFSLGIVLYELLTSARPFQGDNIAHLLERIRTADVRPLRQRDGRIPQELERICLKALQKRAADRYATAADLAEDLQLFIEVATGHTGHGSTLSMIGHGSDALSREARSESPMSLASGATNLATPIVVPKGLRSYDRGDAAFFLQLLPGPFDREGIPESIRFWLQRIGRLEDHAPFRVGMVFGPSGSGKSSLIRAGVLPLLPEHVMPIVIDATPHATVDNLRAALHHSFSSLEADWTLSRMIAALRATSEHRQHGRVLIVLDQFEQAMQSDDETSLRELVAALRQCDGDSIQCLGIVRDDFWLHTERIMHELEIPLVEGRNSAVVDRFAPRHAASVLEKLGRAFGDLPADPSPLATNQNRMIDQVVKQLSDDGKVIAIHLVMVAQMLRGKSWTPKTLLAFGGAQGIGVAFLEEMLGPQASSPERRQHRIGLHAILSSLLPERGVAIRGRALLQQQLMQEAGYESRPREFQRLLEILDQDLRLITPVSASDVALRDGESFSSGPIAYQLAHDHLVPSLRTWLTIKRRETRRGRAELRLEQLTDLWYAQPQRRMLPTWLEYASIRMLVPIGQWTSRQRDMLAKAGRLHLRNSVMLLAAVTIAVVCWKASATRSRFASYLSASPSQAAQLLEELQPSSRWLSPSIRAAVQSPTDQVARRGHIARLAWHADNVAARAASTDYLLDVVTEPSTNVAERPLIWNALQKTSQSKAAFAARLPMLLENSSGTRLLATAATAARLELDEADQAKLFDDRSADLASSLVDAMLHYDGRPSESPWVDALRSNGERLRTDLLLDNSDAGVRTFHELFSDDAKSVAMGIAKRDQRWLDFSLATLNNLPAAKYREAIDQLQTQLSNSLAANQLELAKLQDAIAQWQTLTATVSESAGTAEQPVAELAARRLKAKQALAELDDKIATLRDQIIKLSHEAANSAIALWTSGFVDDQSEQLWRHPVQRFRLVERIGWLHESKNLAAAKLWAQLGGVEQADETTATLILALGKLRVQDLVLDGAVASDAVATQRLLSYYSASPRRDVHAAAAWTLRRWAATSPSIQSQFAERLQLISGIRRKGHEWRVDREGRDWIIYAIGDQVFEALSTEVPEGSFVEWLQTHRDGITAERQERITRTDHVDRACANVSWFEAAEFCNWMSAREELPSEQWCYESNSDGRYESGMHVAEDYRQRRGYRMLDQQDWQLLAMSDVLPAQRIEYTRDPAILSQMAWYGDSSQRTAPTIATRLPNRLGAYDLFGGVWEWTNTTFDGQPGEPVVGDVYCCGGSVVNPIDVLSKLYYYSAKEDENPYIGFRVMRRIK